MIISADRERLVCDILLSVDWISMRRVLSGFVVKPIAMMPKIKIASIECMIVFIVI